MIDYEVGKKKPFDTLSEDEIMDIAWMQYDEQTEAINVKDYIDNSWSKKQSTVDCEFIYFLDPKINSCGIVYDNEQRLKVFSELSFEDKTQLALLYYNNNR